MLNTTFGSIWLLFKRSVLERRVTDIQKDQMVIPYQDYFLSPVGHWVVKPLPAVAVKF